MLLGAVTPYCGKSEKVLCGSGCRRWLLCGGGSSGGENADFLRLAPIQYREIVFC